MKKLFFLFTLFLSCSKSNNIEGVWIGEYETVKHMPQVYAEQSIISFENKKCYFKNLKANDTNEWVSEDIYSFEKILFKRSEEVRFNILKQKSDSLVISVNNNSLPFKVYRRLSDTLKNSRDINLKGKKFIWKNKFFTDTIFFKNSLKLVRSSMKERDLTWNRNNFKGFDVLLLNRDVPYIIRKKVSDTVYLSTLHKESINHIFVELKN